MISVYTTNPAIKWIKKESKDEVFFDASKWYGELVCPHPNPYVGLIVPIGYELHFQSTSDGWPIELVSVSQVEVPRERRSFWRRLWERK